MAELPLFYKNPVPLDAKAHADLRMRPNFGLGFTEGVNAVPINLIEMPLVCHHYPIAFSPDGNATPVAILGLRDNENLFLNNLNEWLPNTYIPAYVRRYPFIFSEIPGGDQLSLCFDMVPETISETKGDRFFEPSGEPGDLSLNALEFCKSYHAAAQQTLQFSEYLNKLNIVVAREAEISIGQNKQINFSGFGIIDEAKLAELDAATFLDLREKGFLPFIYAHLFSGANWQKLTSLLNDRLEGRVREDHHGTSEPSVTNILLQLEFDTALETVNGGQHAHD